MLTLDWLNKMLTSKNDAGVDDDVGWCFFVLFGAGVVMKIIIN
jgi:hypothetical protein